MKKKQIFRIIMLAAGLLAVGVILISSSFSKIASGKEIAKAKTEQGSAEKQTFISAPTEAIPGTAVKLSEDSSPSLLETLFANDEEKSELPPTIAKELVRYFKVLFRVFVSPNAP